MTKRAEGRRQERAIKTEIQKEIESQKSQWTTIPKLHLAEQKINLIESINKQKNPQHKKFNLLIPKSITGDFDTILDTYTNKMHFLLIDCIVLL